MVTNRAFTLIELLIVVAIIAILAAIAVPNFLEAQVRSKVSRTKADMRSLAIALEAYAVDNNNYPVPDGPTLQLPHGLGSVSTFTIYKGAGMTTPIAYITSIPNDPFGPGHFLGGEMATTNLEYYYATKYWFEDDPYVPTAHVKFPWRTAYSVAETHAGLALPDPNDGPWYPKWNLQSRGPDQYLKRTVNESSVPLQNPYDPTNGTVSFGNITRMGP